MRRSKEMTFMFATVLGVASCHPQPAPSVDVMSTGSCDTTPIKPLGRASLIPAANTLDSLSVLVGTVVQAETGDALQSAIVDITRLGDSTAKTVAWRLSDSKGGFVFDSIAPASYRLRARRVGSVMDTARVILAAGRIDTVRFRMRTFRCYGY